MNRSFVFVSMVAAAALCACQSSNVKIDGRFSGSEAKQVYLERVNLAAQQIVDSTQLASDGSYKFTLKGVSKMPTLYNVVFDGERIPLFVQGGENIELSSVGSLARNYIVEGSEESVKLREFYQSYIKGAQELNRIAGEYQNPQISESTREELAKEYSSQYYKIRQDQIKFIVENKSSHAAVYALYQRLPSDQETFSDSDVIYFRTVADAIEERYPESPYLSTLRADIRNMEARAELMSSVVELDYPELEMPDIYGKKIKLSSLEGKAILLDFWSAQAGNSNVNNADLKLIYEKYKEMGVGFEIYQVGIDTSKALWITTVQDQALPWISVSDLLGGGSPALGHYNVTSLPANFLINPSGEIVARNIGGKELEEQLVKMLK